MTPESIPGRLIPEELEQELWASPVYHHGPAYLEHELFLTDLPQAA